ncbi:hypothetical protein GCM10027514_26070 [Azotobacter armeniacus]
MQQHRQAASPAREQDWPRDFDFRAEYAEQQELLAPERQRAAVPTSAQDTQSDE